MKNYRALTNIDGRRIVPGQVVTEEELASPAPEVLVATGAIEEIEGGSDEAKSNQATGQTDQKAVAPKSFG